MEWPKVYAAEVSEGNSIKVKSPSKNEKGVLRILIVIGITSLLIFANFLFNKEHIGLSSLYLLLCVSLSYKILRILHEWYYYWDIGMPEKPLISKVWKVDMLTTAVPEEPFEMIQNTLLAMKRVRYPHTTYLCDEGNDPKLQALCQQLGVVYVTRTDKSNAKAGNINNALQIASGEICVILDPDHEPLPNFLDEVLPYFENPEIGFVQVVQAYKNTNESLIACGAAQQTYTFYGPLMMGMSNCGVAQAIGANCTFRRKALDSIGGHAPGLAEDMHTAMQLHAKGWKSVYVPVIVSRGLVPSTLSSYYKQQLKWSRGTFDLLFYVYPHLFKNFTWRQKVHYFLLPLHYLAGLIILIDFAIPIGALLTGETPLLFELNSFLPATVPLFAMALLIRQYAQRWLLEERERGLHLTGGILLAGTWWVFLVGFIYTIFKIKVPYIATPKEDEYKNSVLLSLPNIGVCLLTLCAIGYGLYRDWTPYNLAMSGYATINIMLLAITILAGQQLFFKQIRDQSKGITFIRFMLQRLQRLKVATIPNTYHIVRAQSPLLIVIISFSCSSILLINNAHNKEVLTLKLPLAESQMQQESGGFYSGIYMPDIQAHNNLAPLIKFEGQIGKSLNIVSIYQSWGPESLKLFPSELLQNISRKGGIPMITWEPYVSLFPETPANPELRFEKNGLAAIASGKLNDYILQYALKIREYKRPVFLRFAHETDNPAYPWSGTGGNTPGDYIAAWRQVVSVFAEAGVNNVSWVWTPWNPSTSAQYYPGDQFVDWIGLTCLNYGAASQDGKWRTFEEIYHPFRKEILKYNKPVMLAEFGSTNYGGDGYQWLQNTLSIIPDYQEIKSLVFFNSNQDRNWITSWRPSSSEKFIDWEIKEPERIAQKFERISLDAFKWRKGGSQSRPLTASPGAATGTHHAPFMRGGPGNYDLLVAGKPFYIKGVAYNSGHEWRDGNYPPTRKQLEKDFTQIKAMGANTIRRYQPSIYDKNILTVAQEKDLKVLFGFWFDPQIDYYKDSLKVKAYISQVEAKVLKYKSYPAVLAWGIGNETSGLLKKKFGQPYLTLVRQAYMKMIEAMAQRIHEIDPSRPVFTALEHSWQLPGELFSFHHLVPSVDIISINSYYTQQINKLHQLTAKFDGSRPYLVSEFGPSGYWNPELSVLDRNKNVLEESDLTKANLYVTEWKEYVNKHRGYNIGGVAYCWRDRLEGSATWFGITDFQERKKPVYHALQKAWKGSSQKHPLPKVFIIGPTFKLHPDSTYNFKVLAATKFPVKIEWKMYEEGLFRIVKSIKNTDSPDKIQVKMPRKTEKGRLHVFVYDKAGNVMTANKVIALYKTK